MPEIRYEAALDAARTILAAAGMPETPSTLGRVAYAVLDAIYAAERRPAGQAGPMPCPGCQRPLCPADDAGLD
jgi:hypothetical protein